jgi:hypothetical protein
VYLKGIHSKDALAKVNENQNRSLWRIKYLYMILGEGRELSSEMASRSTARLLNSMSCALWPPLPDSR